MTKDKETPELLAVTQADREAAADLIEWHNTAATEWHIEGGADLRFFAADMPDGVRKGIWDQHDFVQAFARHRLASTRPKQDSGLADELERLLKAATPGPWEIDSDYNADALATGGGGCTQGFNDWSLAAEVNGKWLRVLDSSNSDLKEVEDDRDYDGGSAWDAVGRANLELVSKLVNSLPAILTALRSGDAELLKDELELALCAPNWAASLTHVHNTLAKLNARLGDNHE